MIRARNAHPAVTGSLGFWQAGTCFMTIVVPPGSAQIDRSNELWRGCFKWHLPLARRTLTRWTHITGVGFEPSSNSTALPGVCCELLAH